MPGPDSRSPEWRFHAAAAYLEALEDRGLSLRVHGDRIGIPRGHTPGEVVLVGLLRRELLQLMEVKGFSAQMEHPLPREP